MKTKYTHVIWDFNGTLVDDTHICVKVMNNALTKRNMPQIDIAKYRSIFCFPVIDYYKKLGFTFEDEPFEKVGMEFISNYEKEKNNCLLHEGVKDVLKKLQSLGISQSVLSAYHTDNLNDFIKNLGIDIFFNHIIGLDNHYAESKTHLGTDWIKKQKIDKEHILMIGDTVHDKEVADAMGIDIVLLPYGHQKKSVLEKSGAKILNNFAEITDIIKS